MQVALLGISRAKVTVKRSSAGEFPQSSGLQWTPTDSAKSWCARWDLNPQFSARDGGFKDRCVFQFHHVRINAVRVGRISGSPLHLSLLHLQSCQLKNRSLYKSVRNFPMGSGELQVWSLPLLSVRFSQWQGCWQRLCLLLLSLHPALRNGLRAIKDLESLRDSSDFPVHNKRCLWKEVEKLEVTSQVNVNKSSLCPKMLHHGCAKKQFGFYVQEGEFMWRHRNAPRASLFRGEKRRNRA